MKALVLFFLTWSLTQLCVAQVNVSKYVAKVSQSGKYGLIDKSGNWILKPQYDELEFSEGFAIVKQNNDYFAVDWKGNVVIPKIEHSEVSNYAHPYFWEGFASVCKDGKWGFIDKKGKLIIPYQYDKVTNFSEGMAGVYRKGKWGFVTATGDQVIPCQYDKVYDFQEGLAGVCQNHKWGFIDKSGRVIIPLQFQNYAEGGDLANAEDITKGAMPFNNGFAKVNFGNQSHFQLGYIDKTGARLKFADLPKMKLTHIKDNYYYGYQDVTFIKGKSETPVPIGTIVNRNGKPFFPAIDHQIKNMITQMLDHHGAKTDLFVRMILHKDYVSVIIQGSLPNNKHFNQLNNYDFTGQVLFSASTAELKTIHCADGLCTFKDTKTGKYGYIDKSGNYVIPAKFDTCEQFESVKN